MLLELHVRDFALIDRLSLSLAPGFNVLTGETGAGKSIIIDALQLALGERAAGEVIRSGAEEARVEAVFDLTALPDVRSAVAELGLGEAGEMTLILTRDLHRNGRGLSRVNGRPVTQGVVRQLARGLLELHGQHASQNLFRTETHRDRLDALGGPEVLALGRRVAQLAGALAGLVAERRRLTDDERERLRRLDLLRFQVEEIERVGPRPGEEEELAARRQVLVNAERLAAAAVEAFTALYEGAPGQPAAADALSRHAQELLRLSAVDPRLGPLGELLQGAALQAIEAAHELRRYRDETAFDPGELAAVEERLACLRQLGRKYGQGAAEILAYRAEAAAEVERLANAEASAAAMDERITALRRELAEAAAALSARRAGAAGRVEAGMAAEMAELGLEKACFQVAIRRVPDPEGLFLDGETVAWDRGGVDRVEFLFSANPGEPPQPLSRVASGGEASRLALALTTALLGTDGVSTLIFDEVDAGIGGRTAQAVARRLAALGCSRQVLCVTHLAVVAAAATAHFAVSKGEDGGRTHVLVRRLEDGERPAEIARMLAGDDRGETSLRHAQEMLAERPASGPAATQGGSP